MGNSFHTPDASDLVYAKNESTSRVNIRFMDLYQPRQKVIVVQAGQETCLEASGGDVTFLDNQGKGYCPCSQGKILPKLTVDNVVFSLKHTAQGSLEILAIDA